MTKSGCWLLCLCIACSTSDQRARGAADLPDASEPDLVASAAAWFDEYDHEVEVTCPCRVEQGGFPSLDECMRVLAIADSTVDCLTEQLVPADSDELRATLRCMAEAAHTRSACLATSTCAREPMNACYDLAMECPMFDPQLLTRAFTACPDSLLLGRLPR